MKPSEHISSVADEPTNFSQRASEQIGQPSEGRENRDVNVNVSEVNAKTKTKVEVEGQMRETDVRKQDEEQARLEQERQCEEEENQLNARLQLLELETSGKQYFKPSYGNTYILTFNRKNAFLVRGTPSAKLTREVPDKHDKNISHEVPVTEFVHEVTHENGDVQTWSITSKELHKLIIEELQKGPSTIKFMKEKTGPRRQT